MSNLKSNVNWGKNRQKINSFIAAFLLMAGIFAFTKISSAAVGLQVGNSGLILGESENLIYGIVADTSLGNLLLLQKQSSDIFRITSAGFVGIGVTNPLVKLDIASSTGIQIDVRGGRITNLNSPIDSTDAVPRFYVDNNFAPISGGASLWGGTTTGAIWNLNSGNVGIGTTNPLYKLDVAGNIRVLNPTGGTTVIGSLEQRYPYLRLDSWTSNNTGYFWGFGYQKNDGTNQKIHFLVKDSERGIYSADKLDVITFTANEMGQNSPTLYPSWSTPIHLAASGNTWLNGGNVGIGTTNPTYKLHVVGDSYVTGTMRLVDGNGINWSSGSASISTTGSPSYSMLFNTYNGTANTEKMRVTGSGNVGIGTTNPASKLDIGGISNTNAASMFGIYNSVVLGSAANSYLYPMEIQGRANNLIRLQSALYRRGTTTTDWGGTAYRLQYAVDGSFTYGSKAFVEIGASDPTTNYGGFISLGTNGVDRLSILNSGSVGIGTTSPTSTLHIAGGTGRSLYMDGGRIGGLSIIPLARDEAVTRGYLEDNYTLTASSSSWLLDGNTVGSIKKIGTKDAYDLPIITSNVERMRITSGGNVGVGTTSPDNLFHVYGASARQGAHIGNAYVGNYTDANYVMFGVSALAGDATKYAFIQSLTGTTIFNSVGTMYFATNNVSKMTVGANGGLALGSTYYSSNPGANNMIVEGSVGVGTTNPDSLLHVNGNIETNVGSGFLNNVYYSGGWKYTNNGYGLAIYSSSGKQLFSVFANNSAGGHGATATEIRAMAIDQSSGNVGIGTTSPTSILHIAGGTGRTLYMDGGRIGGLDLTPTENDEAVPLGYLKANYNSSSTAFWSGSLTGNISNANLGNVGIGTTNPVQKLTVGTAGDGGRYIILPYASGDTVGFQFGDSSNVLKNTFGLAWNMDTYHGLKITRNSGGSSDPYFTVGTKGGNTDFAVKINGNVGIGTTNPLTKLQVGADGTSEQISLGALTPKLIVMGDKNNTSSDSILRLVRPTNPGNLYPASVDFKVSSYGTLGSPFNAKTQLTLALKDGQTYDTGNTVDVMTLRANGNVGIGTTSPYSKLHLYDATAGPIISLSGLNTNYRGLTVKDTGNNEQWFSGANNVNNFVIRRSGTTDNLTIASTTGYVGIGTTNPARKLDISGVSDWASQVRITRTDNNTITSLGSRYVGSFSNNSFSIFSNSSERMTIDPTGNVGINTTAPKNKLDVSGGMALGSYAGVNTAPSNSLIVSGNIGIGTTSPTSTLHIAGGTGRTLYMGGGSIGGLNSTPTADDEAVPLGYLEANYSPSSTTSFWSGSLAGDISNANSGNIGIGTSSPGAKLDVAGATGLNASFASSGAVGNSNYIAIGGKRAYIGYDGVNQNTVIQGIGGKGIEFNVNSDTFASGTVMRISSSGNVGIGPMTPQSKLEVNIGAESAVPAAGAGSTYFILSGTGSYGMMAGVLGTGKGYIQQQRFDGNTTMYDLLLQPNGGNIGVGTTTPGAKLEVYGGNMKINGGSLFMASTAGQTATQLQSYNNASGLWLIQPTSESLILADSLSWDRSMSISYTAGTTGAGAGRLTIGQTTKLGANFTHGITSFYTNGSEQLRIDNAGFVGIGTTAPTSTLHIAGGTGRTLYMDGGRIGGLSIIPLARDEAVTRGYLEDNYTSSTTMAGFLPLSGGNMTGDVNFGNKSITNLNTLTVTKINATTIDPLYHINNINYSTFVASISGGVKEEYVGKADIKRLNSRIKEYEYIINFALEDEGSDLWVWRKVVDYSNENVQVFITPSGKFADVYYVINDNKLTFRSDRPVEISYRLIGKRFDWRNWPTKALNQTEKGVEIK